MAFELEGFCVVRGPDVLWGGDIRSFHPPAGTFDGVIGGPPCQTFSALANLVRANGYEPRFGNLIPEFERVVAAAAPQWFLMENVPAAPLPAIAGYQVASFILDNCMLDAGDGYGEQQERKRRFSFGVRGDQVPPSLLRWIQPAALLLPRAGAVTQTHIDNSPEAKARTGGVVAYDVRAWPRAGAERTPAVRGTPRIREQAVLSDPHAVPVVIGGSGKRKPRAHCRRSRVREYLELQGLPPDFLADAPFTVEGKRKAVANGVPLPMGRAIARAVKAALASTDLLAEGSTA
jgi:DNA (cytosine-5)-methyltransferase 1